MTSEKDGRFVELIQYAVGVVSAKVVARTVRCACSSEAGQALDHHVLKIPTAPITLCLPW